MFRKDFFDNIPLKPGIEKNVDRGQHMTDFWVIRTTHIEHKVLR